MKLSLDVIIITHLSEYNRELMNLKDNDLLLEIMDKTANKIIKSVNNVTAAPELLEFAKEMVKRYPNSPWIYEEANRIIKKVKS